MIRDEALKIAKPILFNTEMTRALSRNENPKTATRRLIKLKGYDILEAEESFSENNWFHVVKSGCEITAKTSTVTSIQPPYQVGDILYVRETWGRMDCNECDNVDCEQENCKRRGFCYRYKSDGSDKSRITDGWHPSIHMPKEIARYFLRVTDVRVERLQNIDGYGILAEGVDNGNSNPTMEKRWENMQRMAYSELWNSTVKKTDIKKYGWNANPWVWVIEFERLVIEA